MSPAALVWKPPSVAGTDSTPGPSVRPWACSRNAPSTASMQSESESRSKTSARDSTRIDTCRPEAISAPPRRGRVEPLEERHALGEGLLIVGGGGEQRPDRNVDTAGLLVGILPVAQIRLVNDLGESREAPVTEFRSLDEGLERAVLTLMTELDAGRVKRDGVGRKVRWRREDEDRLGIDETLDQPGRRHPVDVGPGPSDPAALLQLAQVET